MHKTHTRGDTLRKREVSHVQEPLFTHSVLLIPIGAYSEHKVFGKYTRIDNIISSKGRVSLPYAASTLRHTDVSRFLVICDVRGGECEAAGG